jgi:hypothetical protein
MEFPSKKGTLMENWPADKIERRSLAELTPYARNARTHSDAQVAQIAASIREWGWTMPVLVDELGSIIAGHGRILAAARLGIGEAPVMVARGWSEAQKRAYVIADNKLTENGGWDTQLLEIEVADLASVGFDLSLLGFGEGELFGGAETSPSGSLADQFMIPPFSVFNAREGWWQNRKRLWLALGIQSELGRGENLQGFSDTILEPDPAKRRAKNGRGRAIAQK